MTDIVETFTGWAALAGQDLSWISTIPWPPERRHIYIAMGKERNNGERAVPLHFPLSLCVPGSERARIVMRFSDGTSTTVGRAYPSVKKLPFVPLVQTGSDTFECYSEAQGVQYILHVITKKTDFVKALQTERAYVIYNGHARYGRGPCFGSSGSSTGEEWEEGVRAGPPVSPTAFPSPPMHPNETGIFRMAYPYLCVEAEEIVEHGYMANLVLASVPLTKPDCDPDLWQKISSNRSALKALRVADIMPSLRGLVRDPDPDKLFWTWGTAKKRFVVLHAGWNDTISEPDDLGAVAIKCRVLCHFGCSTLLHNQPVVRKLKGWAKQTNQYAYFTDKPSQMIAGHYFLQHLLTYKTKNAYQDIEPSLEYARKQANANLAADNAGFQLI